MGCCFSVGPRNRDQYQREDVETYMPPIISADDIHSPKIFEPDFSLDKKKSNEIEISINVDDIPNINLQSDVKLSDAQSDSSSIDQDMIQQLLAEVDTSGTSD